MALDDWVMRYSVGLYGGTGFEAIAYRRGSLDPDPTEEDARGGALFAHLYGQRNLSPNVRSAIGYTPELAFANLAHKLSQED